MGGVAWEVEEFDGAPDGDIKEGDICGGWRPWDDDGMATNLGYPRPCDWRDEGESALVACGSPRERGEGYGVGRFGCSVAGHGESMVEIMVTVAATWRGREKKISDLVYDGIIYRVIDWALGFGSNGQWV